MNNSSPKIESWGTPLKTGSQSAKEPAIDNDSLRV